MAWLRNTRQHSAFCMSTSLLDQCHLRSAVTGQPNQPPILCETINKYQPKCGDALAMWRKVMMAHSTCRYRHVGCWLNCVIPHNTCHAHVSALEMSIAHNIECYRNVLPSTCCSTYKDHLQRPKLCCRHSSCLEHSTG